MAKTALIVRHVHFEDLGSFARPLSDAGYAIRYSDIEDPDFLVGDPTQDALVVILGGPIGVYEDAIYPFLSDERDFISRRLAQGKPTLGICLGAQLIAAALGARVFAAGVREIGFAPIDLSDEGKQGCLRHLEGVPVLHWHGDTFEQPPGANHLAATQLVEQQAFSLGPNILGLQFHPEVDIRGGFERWLVGHAHELATAGIDIPALRADAARFGNKLSDAADRMLREWIAGLDETL